MIELALRLIVIGFASLGFVAFIIVCLMLKGGGTSHGWRD